MWRIIGGGRMKEFAEKLIEQIRKKKEYHKDFYEKMGCTEHDKDLHKATQLAFDECMEIVEELSKEYKSNGWIPVSERLPEYGEKVFVFCPQDNNSYLVSRELAVYGEDVWENENMEYEDITTYSAWMPLPEPYKGE